MSDLISRQAAIDAIGKKQGGVFEKDAEIDTAILYVYSECKAIIKALPSVQPTHPTPSNALGALDCVSREDLTKGIEAYFGDLPITVHYDMLALAQKLPSVQPTPCEFCKHNNIADDKACLMCSAERRTE